MKFFFLHISVVVAAAFFLNAGLSTFRMPTIVDQVDFVADAGVDVAFLGDSCVVEVAPDDTDRRNLVEMLDDKMYSRKVASLGHFAYNGEVYAGISTVLARGSNKPRAMLIPVNLRSFSPTWNYKPEYQFEREKFLLNNPNPFVRSILRPLVIFHYVDLLPITHEAYNARELPMADGTVERVVDFENTLKMGPYDDELYAKQFSLYYGGDLQESHRKLQGILQAVRTAKEAGIIPIVYVTPIDQKMADRYVGTSLLETVSENIGRIRDALGDEAVALHDFSLLLGADAFCYQVIVHEHMDQEGRENLIEELVPIIEAELGA